MSYWRRETLEDITQKLSQLGLVDCRVCSGGSLATWTQPALIHVGGLNTKTSPDSNVGFGVIVLCQVCGHVLLFDSEQFSGPSEYVLSERPPQS